MARNRPQLAKIVTLDLAIVVLFLAAMIHFPHSKGVRPYFDIGELGFIITVLLEELRSCGDEERQIGIQAAIDIAELASCTGLGFLECGAIRQADVRVSREPLELATVSIKTSFGLVVGGSFAADVVVGVLDRTLHHRPGPYLIAPAVAPRVKIIRAAETEFDRACLVTGLDVDSNGQHRSLRDFTGTAVMKTLILPQPRFDRSLVIKAAQLPAEDIAGFVGEANTTIGRAVYKFEDGELQVIVDE